MDSFEINKIVAAVLMVALLLIGIGKLSDIIFYVEKPEIPAYAVESEQVVTTIAETSSKTIEEKIQKKMDDWHKKNAGKDFDKWIDLQY